MTSITGEVKIKIVHLNLLAYGKACGKPHSATEEKTTDVCKVTCKFCLNTRIYKRMVQKAFADIIDEAKDLTRV